MLKIINSTPNDSFINLEIVLLLVLSSCFKASRNGRPASSEDNFPITKWAMYLPNLSVVSSTLIHISLLPIEFLICLITCKL